MPRVPDEVFKALVTIALGAIGTSIVQITGYYETWQDSEVERNKQVAILQIEEDHLRSEPDQTTEAFRLKAKEIAIRRAEVASVAARAVHRRNRWEKAAFWGNVLAIGAFGLLVSLLWRRPRPPAETAPSSNVATTTPLTRWRHRHSSEHYRAAARTLS